MKYKMKDFARKHGLTLGKHCVWGVFGGYHIHIKYTAVGNPRCLVTVVTRVGEKQKSLEKYLEGHKQKLGIASYGVIGIGLMLCPKFSGEVFARAESVLQELCAHLKKAGYPGADFCPYCGEPLGEGDPITTESDIPFRAHEACYREMLSVARAKDEENAKKPDRKGLGAFGGFLGALFGAVLFVLTYAWWNFGALGGAAGVLLAYFLYRKLGGKETVFAVSYTAAAALILSLAGFAFGLYMDAFQAGGSWQEVVSTILSGGAGTALFAVNLAFAFVFVGAGAALNVRSYLRSRRTVADRMRILDE